MRPHVPAPGKTEQKSDSARRLALHDEAQALHDEGREDEAILKYREAIAADPAGAASSYYNIGLIHKYRKQWQASFDANLRANTLDPDDESARWNLAIAATALKDWGVARRAWADQGLKLDGEGPIAADFGQTPVRLDPDGRGEVVWARRIDPVRARIENIPLAESGFCCGDVVLHDGAPTGQREFNGRSYSVFNVLELFEPSPLSTFELCIDAPDAATAGRLVDHLKQADMHVEDWTASVHVICKRCSEGVPHEHEHDAGETAWQTARRIGIAAVSQEQIDAALAAWQADGGAAGTVECVLAADEFEEPESTVNEDSA